jgi:sulfide:quinone oxidoreductase
MVPPARRSILDTEMEARSSVLSECTNVVVAGGGVAALEAVLALRALADDRVHITLVAPGPELTFRPSAPFEAFGPSVTGRLELEAIARDVGASFGLGRLEALAPRARTLRLASGQRLEFDALVLAIGARANAGLPGAVTFRDQRDIPQMRRILRAIDTGTITRLAFAVPPGSSWSLPLYELALLSATRAERSSTTEIVLVSPEQRPLEIFGSEASRLVGDDLAARGVRFIPGSAPTGWRNGELVIDGDAPIRADRVVTVAQLRVPRITGVPRSSSGFIPTDSFGRVEGLRDVYAAGDATTYPIKQGGLATQQADRVAHTIAANAGAPVKQLRSAAVLRARLLGGARPLLLRTELDWQGRPNRGTVAVAGSDDAEDGSKVFGRYLTPYLQRLARGSHAAA